jgi:glycosyltransferase involved in cell wall biosynthesis
MLMNSLDVAVVCYADDAYGKYCFPQKTREFMSCGVPLIAAAVGSLKELLSDHPQWLYQPGSADSLAGVLENRISDRSIDYASIPSWTDLADSVEQIMIDTIRRYR